MRPIQLRKKSRNALAFGRTLVCTLAPLLLTQCLEFDTHRHRSGLIHLGPGNGNTTPPEPGAPTLPGIISQFAFGLDQGIRSQRSLADYNFSVATMQYETNVIGASGQPAFSWDGKLRFTPSCGYYGGTHALAGRWFCGLLTHIVDFENTRLHEDGNIAFAYKTGSQDFPKGAPLFQSLMRGRPGTGPCGGEFLYAVSNSSCGSNQIWETALDGSQFAGTSTVNPLTGINPNLNNPTTLFSFMWHAQILPNPDSPHHENPYLSDAAGNLATGVTNFMTYDVLLMASIVGTPQAYDLDAGRPGRERIGFVLGKVVTEFQVTEGNHRMPNRIVSATLDKASFGIARTSLTAPQVVRGIEPTMDRFGQLLVTNLSFYTTNLDPGSTSPLTNHAAVFRRLQGKFSDPYCARGTPGCVPLLFSGPSHLSGLHTLANTNIPGSDLKYGQQYLLARYPIATPLGEHVYGPTEMYGTAYPWLSLDGNAFFHTASFGVGRYLDRDGPAATFQTRGGLEYCLRGDHCIGGTLTNPSPAFIGANIMRESTSVVGPLETVVNGQRVFQMQPLDSKLNEAPRTLARVTSWSSGFWSGLWGWEPRLPVRLAANFKSSPGPFAMPTFVAMNNFSNLGGGGFIGRDEATTHGQPIPGTQFQGNLFYSPLQMTGRWLADNRPGINSLPAPTFANPENYTRYGTMILTDVTRAQDVSGNNLQVNLHYTDAQGGVFFPPNDPVNSYTSAIGDNERQKYLFGRFGNGVGCSSDGLISITEDTAISRPGTLSSYSQALTVMLWANPRVFPSGSSAMILARAPAYTLSILSDGRVSLHVRTNMNTLNYVTTGTLPVQAWSHVLAEMSVDPVAHRLNTRILINGSAALVATSDVFNTLTALAPNDGSPWHFCPGGASAQHDHVLNVDEITIAARVLTPQEIRIASLQQDPEHSPQVTSTSQAALLGPLGPIVDFFGYDPRATYVPSNNPITQAKLDFGKKLFFETRLSSTQTVSCSSCHVPSMGYGTPEAGGLGRGVNNQFTLRAPNRIVNLLFSKPESRFNWDGRAASLEAQIAGPLTDAREMAMGTLQAVENRARTFGGASGGNYYALSNAAFGVPMAQITETQVRMALATFVRGLIVGDAPYDRYVRGDASALTPQQRLGFGIFTMNCVGCHHGAGLTNHSFASIGIYPDSHSDLGRGGFSKNTAEMRAFKTPGLRDLHLREGRGFGHDGSIQTIQTFIANYRNGGTHQTQNIHHDIHAIPLSNDEQIALEDFLRNGLRSSTLGQTIYTITAP